MEAALNAPTPLSWYRFLSFSYCSLKFQQHTNSLEKLSAAASIRSQLEMDDPWGQGIENPFSSTRNNFSCSDESEKLAARVRSKCADGDIKAALRVLTSDDSLLPPSNQTIEALRTKHPEAPADENIPDLPATQTLIVDIEQVLAAVKSIPSGSSAGLDGMRPLFLQQMLSQDTVETGRRLLSAITRLVNLILAGQIPEYARTAVFGASLVALRKNDGGVRPIAIGSVYRRLAGRIAAHHASQLLSSELKPVQLGVGVPGGCESAVHAAREYIAFHHGTQATTHVMVKIDVKNAFNSIRRDTFLHQIHSRCPDIYNMARQAYGTPTPLYIGDTLIASSTGVQQGDPIGPLAFSLAIDACARNISSEFNIWYLDDATIAGPASTIVEDLRTIQVNLHNIGLELNPRKCEVAFLGQPFSPSHSSTINSILSSIPNIQETPLQELTLLGSPLLDSGLTIALDKAKSTISRLCERLKHLDSHTALFFLTHHASAPRLSYLLRTSRTFVRPELLTSVDNLIISAAEQATNVIFSNPNSRQQATLPVRHGGLGLRSVYSLALPCYIASLTSSLSLVREICSFVPDADPPSLISAVAEFTTMTGVTDPPTGEAASSQREWDEMAVCKIKDRLLESANQLHHARLLAASAPHTGAWLQALPLPNLGLHLDDDCVRIATALRLGAPVCESHLCRCGRQVDSLGHHGLSCLYSKGRLPRHANLNDVVKRGLAAAGVPSWLEPVGLDRGDGRRPDGLTVFPFSNGKSLCWDATCVDTFCRTAIGETALAPGAAADAAEFRKRQRYQNLNDRYRFEPIAVETTGVFGRSSSKFVAELGRRISATTGDKRETSWLRQRLSIAVVRGNAAAILASRCYNTF